MPANLTKCARRLNSANIVLLILCFCKQSNAQLILTKTNLVEGKEGRKRREREGGKGRRRVRELERERERERERENEQERFSQPLLDSVHCPLSSPHPLSSVQPWRWTEGRRSSGVRRTWTEWQPGTAHTCRLSCTRHRLTVRSPYHRLPCLAGA